MKARITEENGAVLVGTSEAPVAQLRPGAGYCGIFGKTGKWLMGGTLLVDIRLL